MNYTKELLIQHLQQLRSPTKPLALFFHEHIDAGHRVCTQLGDNQGAAKLQAAKALCSSVLVHNPRSSTDVAALVANLEGSYLIDILKPALDEVHKREALSRNARIEQERREAESTERALAKLRPFVGVSSDASIAEVEQAFRDNGRLEIADYVAKGLVWPALEQAGRLLGDAREQSRRFAMALDCQDSVSDISQAIRALLERVHDQEGTEAAHLLNDLWRGEQSFSELRFSDALVATR